ncbi:[Fe-Fe] hydrogenase large subunit C-terminal domain-containing protein [Caloramator sp. CAR-1]|uniref:[Fe-Fe] hydrogenase large subunit C-terminal domain-containing protein n=1 Tax=Caloramator sp. CAR-1 TaxID=3062777 RepID=UPI0026E1420C|nr:[Fe-Fe] hydrogenase large subunit C-terminal domain-containing protein [Caloramator sp. CAR-1]MDO6354220.1 [Fe-Fe] hydrogenase large subunit C-terminal domain-containing protein [Caloramator sp. CAR-1]
MKEIFHSVSLIKERCIGCTKCLMNCPVEAIRIKNGKAIIYDEKCIDCGECIRVCPYGAHVSKGNSLNETEGYKIKVLIPSVTLYPQFGQEINPEEINKALLSLGFDEVFDITFACDVKAEILKKEITKVEKPAISTLCPSIIRLIEKDFPSLNDHIVKMLTPIEISAALIREKYCKMGYKENEIGIFFLTPCPSWITKIKELKYNEKIGFDGAIAISDIYPKLLKFLNKTSNKTYRKISKTGLLWSFSGGQSQAIGIDNFLAVDGIKNVIKLFNDVENGKIKDVDYIEAYACTRGCLGGLFLIENPFNAERIAKKIIANGEFSYNVELHDEFQSKFAREDILKVNLKFADDFESAVKMIKNMNRIINMLPGTDCGLCGSPSCRAFAEDVVKGLANLNDCKFIKNGGE